MASSPAPNYDAYARGALPAYNIPSDATVRLISLSENATFLVEHDGPVGVLRIFRVNYQSETSMRSELAWIHALRDEHTVDTPAIIPSASGDELVTVEVDGVERSVVMFEFIDGHELGDEDLDSFRVVGSTAARLHVQSQQWQRPEWFTRFTWDLPAILGADARWGNWRNGPGLTEEGVSLLEHAESHVTQRIEEYPSDGDTVGLAHCDLRAANIMQATDDSLWVIDFDDCGFSWFLWDLCSTTTFIEQLPTIDDIVAAWMEGYQQIRPLREVDTAVIPDMVFLRRLHILAWLGTHRDSDMAKELGTTYTDATYDIARRYLDGAFLEGAISR